MFVCIMYAVFNANVRRNKLDLRVERESSYNDYDKKCVNVIRIID